MTCGDVTTDKDQLGKSARTKAAKLECTDYNVFLRLDTSISFYFEHSTSALPYGVTVDTPIRLEHKHLAVRYPLFIHLPLS